MLTGGQFHEVHIGFPQVQVLRTDPGAFQDFGKVLLLGIHRPAQMGVEARVALELAEGAAVRHQIVVESLPGAVPQAAGIGQDAHLFPIGVRPVADALYIIQIPLHVPADVIGIEPGSEVLHGLQRYQPHIHGSADFHLGIKALEKMGDERGSRGNDFRRASPGIQRFHHAGDMLPQGGRCRLFPIAVGIEEQVQFPSGLPNSREFFAKDFGDGFRVVIFRKTQDRPAAGFLRPGEIYLPYFRVIQDYAGERVSAQLMPIPN